MNRLPLLVAVACLATAACERKTVVITVPQPTPVAEPTALAEPVAKTKTLETFRLGSAVDSYEREPTAEHHATVKKALAALDGEIAELEALVAKRTGEGRQEAAAKLQNLQTYRTAEMARFTAAQGKAPLVESSSPDARTGADKVGDAAKRTGRSIEDAARRTGDAIKDAVR